MAKNMKTRKGNDGFSYPYTSPDIVIDGNGKSVSKKFDEVSSQLRDIAKQTVIENGKLYLVKADGTKLDQGTNIPSSTGSVDLSNYQQKTDNTLSTVQKEIPKAINEVNDKVNSVKTDLQNVVIYNPDDGDEDFISADNVAFSDSNFTSTNVKGAINEVATQYKDTVKKTIVEGNKIYLVKADGTKLDSGTELPIQEVNLSSYVKKENGKSLITDAERNKLTNLENYDDTSIKNDIQVQNARIDTFTSLKDGSTTGDAELADGRTGADGTIYTNIGDAIRTQCGNLNTLLDIYYEITSNNRIDDSKFVGKNFDTLIGHNGNDTKTFTLATKLKSSSITGFIEFEDGTHPNLNNGFFWYLKCSTGEVDNLNLPVQGTLVSSDNYAKYDQVVIGSWATYDEVIKTFYIGDFYDSYDNFKKGAKSKAIKTMESKISSIAPEQCTFFTKVNNLLKNVTLQKGYAINPSYGLPDAVTGITRTSTDYIELRDDCESTYCNTSGYIYYYDVNKNYLQSITPQSLETPAGIVALPQSDTKIKYIRYTFVTEDDATLSSYWITDQGKPYENDKLYIPSTMLEGMDKTESWYKGKKICAYGDSVTEQNKWQSFVSSYFNCSFYNRGVGGTTVTQINSSTNHMSGDTRIETIPTDSDVVLVFGGHNDWSYASIGMGDIKTDTLSESTSFKSAFALMLKKIQTRCPNAKIITMTPVGGRTEEASTNQDKQFYIRDLCMSDFANAVKEVSAYYGIPCIDINANSGINTLNHTTYIADLIHPNLEGGKLIANEVINGLKRFEPIIF